MTRPPPPRPFDVAQNRPPRPRLRAFAPVPVRSRSDGWTPLRQAEFIGVLAETGSVAAAAAFVGMARETAYRLRRKRGAGEFALAWDIALAIAARRPAGSRRAGSGDSPGLPRRADSGKVTPGGSWRPQVDGLWRPVLRRGRYAGCVFKPRKSALSGGVGRLAGALAARRRTLGAKPSSRAQQGLSA